MTSTGEYVWANVSQVSTKTMKPILVSNVPQIVSDVLPLVFALHVIIYLHSTLEVAWVVKHHVLRVKIIQINALSVCEEKCFLTVSVMAYANRQVEIAKNVIFSQENVCIALMVEKLKKVFVQEYNVKFKIAAHAFLLVNVNFVTLDIH